MKVRMKYEDGIAEQNAHAVKDWAAKHKFELSATGGGGEALETTDKKGRYIMITGEGGCCIPESLTEAVLIGFYHKGCEQAFSVQVDGGLSQVSYIETM